jgi:hypothetical protein
MPATMLSESGTSAPAMGRGIGGVGGKTHLPLIVHFAKTALQGFVYEFLFIDKQNGWHLRGYPLL